MIIKYSGQTDAPKPKTIAAAHEALKNPPAKSVSHETEKVSARISKTYVDIIKERNLKLTDVLSSALNSYFTLQGWLQ